MPNNILYARGFFLTIGKRSGNRRNRTCTDKHRKAALKPNKTWCFRTRQRTDEPRFPHLLQTLPGVKMARDDGEESVDKFSAAGLGRAFRSPADGL